jgi:hypothetical protein
MNPFPLGKHKFHISLLGESMLKYIKKVVILGKKTQICDK